MISSLSFSTCLLLPPRTEASLQCLTRVGLLVFTHKQDTMRMFHISGPQILQDSFITASSALRFLLSLTHLSLSVLMPKLFTTGGAPGLATVCPPRGQLQRMSLVINVSLCYSLQPIAWQRRLQCRSSVFLYLLCHPIFLAPLQHLPSSPAYLAV